VPNDRAVGVETKFDCATVETRLAVSRSQRVSQGVGPTRIGVEFFTLVFIIVVAAGLFLLDGGECSGSIVTVVRAVNNHHGDDDAAIGGSFSDQAIRRVDDVGLCEDVLRFGENVRVFE
jgi:hypothetical protein